MLHKYILRQHVAPFILALLMLLFVLLTNFLLRAIDRFLGKGLGFGIIAEYVGLNMAWILALAAPMAVLVATLMVFGRMSHDNEITALRTAGLSYPSILAPAVVFGVLVCMFLVFFHNQVLPKANHRARLLSSDISRKRPDLGIQVGIFVNDLPSYSMIVRGQDGAGFTDILIYSKDNRTSQVTIYADRGTMQTIDDAILLNLEDGEIHELSLPDYDEYRRLKFAKHRIVIPVDNLYLERRESEQRGDREMDIGMMQEKIEGYLGKIEKVNARIANRITSQTPYHLTGDTSQVATKALMSRWKQAIADSAQLTPGESARLARRANNLERGLTGDYNLLRSYHRGINRYKVEIYKKFAIPFACIAFIIVGAPIGIRARRGGFAVASALSLGFFVIYWALLIAGEELADRALVPPFLAMWAANILLTIIGLLLIWQIHNEHRVWRLDILDLFRKRNIAADDDTAIEQS